MNERQLNHTAKAGADIQKTDKIASKDGSSLALDPTVPPELRADWFLQAVGDPYCLRVGGLSVTLEFSDDAPPLQELLSDFLRRKKNGL